MTFGESVYGEVVYGESAGVTTVTGTLSGALPLLTASMSGTYTAPSPPPSIAGTLSATLPKLVASLSGTYTGAIPTDTSNAFDGLDVLLTARVIFAVPVATPPASVATTHVDKAIAYPTPVMVGGRPT